mmetsp:Transcript_23583/g.48961  ORF Transcript_23583/g.48961 Transcript_23583/m.48961 type:complete len:300 (-) Transcript_23583:143-1042(-)|eukprot:CAMPEP_0172458882 /NCGR_PEP_ID=MMETSP1065-20121228/29883_1 /TAXON_ID=265537 /ORGANISM="Amphiprora paludosa, Strain CCMP125" /LENGTH=299 /DNA_ID=CAMNT_0013213339 /DNA_START=192 /DNA_END=1091 /DNA_ORIENTATION=+
MRASSSPDDLSSTWLQFLIGPAASTKSLPRSYSDESGDDVLAVSGSNTWLWTFVLGMIVGGQCMGGWEGFFAELEQYVVPIYTSLVMLYLTILVVAGPVESLYLWIKAQITPTPSTSSLSSAQQQSSQAATVPAVVADNEEATQAPQPFDISGAYKLMENNGFESFLAVQGVPWALRRAANQARPLHRITHKGNQLTIKIEGIIESQTTYIIGGPPVETNVRGRIFEDSVRYLESNNSDNNDAAITGICVSKTALTEDYDVTVQRVLSPDQQEIIMTSRATFRDGRESVECIQKFQRVE